jgi:hypothetical protein
LLTSPRVLFSVGAPKAAGRRASAKIIRDCIFDEDLKFLKGRDVFSKWKQDLGKVCALG